MNYSPRRPLLGMLETLAQALADMGKGLASLSPAPSRRKAKARR